MNVGDANIVAFDSFVTLPNPTSEAVTVAVTVAQLTAVPFVVRYLPELPV